MNWAVVLVSGLLAIVGFAVGMLLPAIRDRIRNGGDRKLREALDDLWSWVDQAGIDALDPMTVKLAKANHERLWHG